MREPPRLALPPIATGMLVEDWFRDAAEMLTGAMAWIKEAVEEIQAPPEARVPLRCKNCGSVAYYSRATGVLMVNCDACQRAYEPVEDIQTAKAATPIRQWEPAADQPGWSKDGRYTAFTIEKRVTPET